MRLYDQTFLYKRADRFVHGIDLADVAFISNRLTRWKRDACFVVDMATDATTDGDIPCLDNGKKSRQ